MPKDGTVHYLQVIFIFGKMMHCLKVRAIREEKKGKEKVTFANIFKMCFLCLLIYKVINVYPLEKKLWRQGEMSNVK